MDLRPTACACVDMVHIDKHPVLMELELSFSKVEPVAFSDR